MLSVRELWSRWCDWLAVADNSRYVEAMLQVGGDNSAIPIYIILLNGWRIVPQSAHHSLEVYDGVLYVDGGGDPFVDPAGSFSIRIIYREPGIAIGYTIASGSGLTPEQSAKLMSLPGTSDIVEANWLHAKALTVMRFLGYR